MQVNPSNKPQSIREEPQTVMQSHIQLYQAKPRHKGRAPPATEGVHPTLHLWYFQGAAAKGDAFLGIQ